MKKNFYLFRHGETEFNRLKLRQGQGVNVRLNGTGKKQAEELAKSAENLGIEVIYSSPLVRAKQTADIVAEKLNVPVIIMSDLTEGDFGKAEGMYENVVCARWPEIINNWYSPDYMDICFPEGETKRHILERMTRAVNELLKTQESNIAVSSHSSALRLFLMSIGGDGRKLPNAKLVHLVWHDGIWKIL